MTIHNSPESGGYLTHFCVFFISAEGQALREQICITIYLLLVKVTMDFYGVTVRCAEQPEFTVRYPRSQANTA